MEVQVQMQVLLGKRVDWSSTVSTICFCWKILCAILGQSRGETVFLCSVCDLHLGDAGFLVA